MDTYAKNEKSMAELNSYEMEKVQLMEFARKLQKIAMKNGMEIGSCAEAMDLESCGIKHNCCIDKKLIE